MMLRRYFAFIVLAQGAALYAAGSVQEINSARDFDALLKSKKVVVAKFEATWCGPCRATQKPFEQAASEAASSNIAFVKIDIDQQKNLTDEHRVMSVPTVVFYVDGQEKHRETGMVDNFKSVVVSRARSYEGGTEASASESIPAAEESSSMATGGFFAGIINLIKSIINWIITKIQGIF